MAVSLNYVTKDDLVNVLTQRDQAMLSDDSVGTPFGADTIDTAKVESFLAYAESFVDTYIAGRYTVPVAAPPNMLKYAVLVIAKENLLGRRNVTKDDKTIYDEVMRWLRDIRDHNADLPLEGDDVEQEEVIFGAEDAVFVDNLFKA